MRSYICYMFPVYNTNPLNPNNRTIITVEMTSNTLILDTDHYM
jgi:hypothetical protein